MNAETIFDRFAHEQGWDMDSQVTILLRYIDNQQSDEAFKDFLREQQDDENAD